MATFVRNSDALVERTYDVLVDGVTVGTVYPSWTRSSGSGWSYSVTDGAAANNGTFPTRQLAARRLVEVVARA